MLINKITIDIITEIKLLIFIVPDYLLTNLSTKLIVFQKLIENNCNFRRLSNENRCIFTSVYPYFSIRASLFVSYYNLIYV